MKLPATHSVTDALPVLAVAAALMALIFFPIPGANLDVVKMILAGLLGALTRSTPSTNNAPTADHGGSVTVAAPDGQQ